MTLSHSWEACRECKLAIAVFVSILLISPSEAAIARSPQEFQQLQREGRGRSESFEKSSESYKTEVPSPTIIEDTQGTPVPDVKQQLIPDPLPPVFDEELALSAPRRLDVLQEAGAELPWPIGSYNAHLRGLRIAANHQLPVPHIGRRLLLIPESPDQRHRYMHSIPHGCGSERNKMGPFGV